MFTIKISPHTIDISATVDGQLVYTQSTRRLSDENLPSVAIESALLAITRTPAELQSDLARRGITLEGAPELQEQLHTATGLPVHLG